MSRQEFRPARLRDVSLPSEATVVVRGGPNTARTLQDAAEDCAARYTLDGVPFLGISVRAVLPESTLADVLAARFTRFPSVYTPRASDLTDANFLIWATFRSPDHFDVQLTSVQPAELTALLAAFGEERGSPAWRSG